MFLTFIESLMIMKCTFKNKTNKKEEKKDVRFSGQVKNINIIADKNVM